MKINYFLILIALIFFGCKPASPLKVRVGANNAIWCQSMFFRGYNPTTNEALTSDEIKTFAETLRDHHIKYAYIFAGPFDTDGHLPMYAFSKTAIHTVSLLKNIYPGLTVLPWIGGIQNQTVHLEDSTWVTNAVHDTKKLVNTLKIRGIHIDFEYILPGDPYLDLKNPPGSLKSEITYGKDVNHFFKKLRFSLPHAFISTVVVATSAGTKPWKRKTDMSDLKTMIEYVDQLSFLYYDTRINNLKIFQDNCVSLVKDIKTLKSIKNIQYLMAIGTFINEPELRKFRNMSIENVPNSLSTIKNSLLKVDSKHKIVDGIAIYCEWKTEKDQWNEFDQYWLNRTFWTWIYT